MLVVDKTRWKMFIYEDKKEVHVQIHGFIRDEFIPEYLVDLTELGKKIQKTAYAFFVDATYQSPLPRKTAAGIGDTMMVYTTFGYKEVTIITPKSKIAFVQVRNGLGRVNFPGKVIQPTSR
ncbi:MAG: hypothetical protein ABS948_03845 [Solibacillus sp.]